MSESQAHNISGPSDVEELNDITEKMEVGEIEEIEADRSSAIKKTDPLLAICGEDLFSVHLCGTAPDREPMIPKMSEVEFRESSVRLFNELAPRNAIEGMMATLAIALWNASLTAISDGTRLDVPTQIRNINLGHGFRGADYAAKLITTYNEMRSGGLRRNVPKLNVEAEDQVSHIDAGRRRRKHCNEEPIRLDQKARRRG